MKAQVRAYLLFASLLLQVNCDAIEPTAGKKSTPSTGRKESVQNAYAGYPVAKLWALACPALLTLNNQHRHDLLWCTDATTENIAHEKRMLAEWWGIHSRADLLQTLTDITTGGSRATFDEMAKQYQDESAMTRLQEKLSVEDRAEFNDRLKIVREYAPKLGFRSLLGWDYARYIALCRWGTLCGYISQDEAWAKIMPAAKLLQNSFTSWADLGENYLIGRRFWQPNSELNQSYKENYMKLLSEPKSPWKTIPWSTSLTIK